MMESTVRTSTATASAHRIRELRCRIMQLARACSPASSTIEQARGLAAAALGPNRAAAGDGQFPAIDLQLMSDLYDVLRATLSECGDDSDDQQAVCFVGTAAALNMLPHTSLSVLTQFTDAVLLPLLVSNLLPSHAAYMQVPAWGALACGVHSTACADGQITGHNPAERRSACKHAQRVCTTILSVCLRDCPSAA
jgi:hypothetical protein